MRQRTILSLLSATVFLYGCAAPLPKFSDVPPTNPITPQPAPQRVAPQVRGQWEFDATSNVAGSSAFKFEGTIEHQSESEPSEPSTNFSGALHVDGSTCFDRLTKVDLSGSATADNGSLTIQSSDGQMVTFTGVFAAKYPNVVGSSMTFTGTYSISGGCTGGDQGKVSGSSIPSLFLDDPWYGTFTSSSHSTFNLLTPDGQEGLFMSSNYSDGVYGISGTLGTQSPCFSLGKLRPGAFPAGSFILGRSVVLKADAGDSVLRIEGTLSDDGGGIEGNYTISGGSCTDSGTVAIQADPWW